MRYSVALYLAASVAFAVWVGLRFRFPTEFERFDTPLWTVAALLVMFGILLVWRLSIVRAEAKYAAKEPDVLTFSTVRTSVFMEQYQSFLRSEGQGSSTVPLGLTGTFSKSGFSLGSPRNPRSLIVVPWSRVLDIQPVDVNELGRTSNGLRVTIQGTFAEGSLDLPVTGAGFAGLYPRSIEQVRAIAERASRLRGE